MRPRRLVFSDAFDPDEDGEHVELRRIEHLALRVTIETPLDASAALRELARDLHLEVQFWLAMDQRR